MNLLEHHRQHLAASGLRNETIDAAKLYSETNAVKIRSLIKCATSTAVKLGPCLVFPFYDIDGRNGYSRVRPDVPRVHGDRELKYESPKGEPNQLYIPPAARDELLKAGELLITEGEKKALAATQAGFPTLGLVGVFGWKKKSEAALLPAFDRINWKRRVLIAFDSDITENANVQKAETWLCHHLKNSGADVKVIRLPSAENGDKVGLDDYLLANGPGELRKLCDNPIDPEEVKGEVEKPLASSADPAIEAASMIQDTSKDGLSKLRFWSGAFWLWSRGRYSEIPDTEVRAAIVTHLNASYAMVCTSSVTNVMEQLKAQTILRSRVQPPSWLYCERLQTDELEWKPEDLVVTRNTILHLPSYVASKEHYCRPATPALFTTCAMDYEFEFEEVEEKKEKPTCPRWMQFVHELWKDDAESIALLQEWYGYCLTPDTSQQKIALVVGPKRSGKGTIARVLRGLIGEGNVCGPTFSSLQTNFGLSPLLGKTLAIISDARLSGRSDQAVIIERLLSISGEDAQTIDRKHVDPITTKLLTRFLIISNELPRLQDSSGAFSGRMLVLRLTESFFNREDKTLTTALLAERAGILQWAIEGWERLRIRGHFVQPASGDELRKQLDELSSPIGAFVESCCEIRSEFSVRVDTLYAGWKYWCSKAGRKPTSKQVMGRDLITLLPSLKRTQPRDGDSRFRMYEGIRLNKQAMDELAEVELARKAQMERDGTQCGTR